MSNFVSYSNAQDLMRAIGSKFAELGGAYIAKGSVAFASLPATPTEAQAGFVYNISDDFTTDSRFVEGSGKDYPAGTNVVIVNNSTYAAVTPAGSEDPSSEGWYELVGGKYVLSEDTSVDSGKTYYAKTVLVQYDVLGSFIDLSDIETAIENVAKMIAGEFDTTEAYSEGDIVVYENSLYQFNTAHAAGAWDASEVDDTTVEELIADALATANTNIANAKAAVEASIAPEFDATTTYEAGDVVYHEDGLYKFNADHAAGAWDPSDVDATTALALITSAEPDELTTAQVNSIFIAFIIAAFATSADTSKFCCSAYEPLAS